MASAANSSAEALLERLDFRAIARRERARQRRRFAVAMVFMAPAIVLVGGLLLYPVLFNIYLSLMNWQTFSGFDEFIGLENYIDLIGQPNFLEAFINTAIWVAASLAFPVLLGLGLALLLRNVRFQDTFKNIIFIPRVLAPTAVGVIWYYIYAPDGLINGLASLVSGREVDIGWLYLDSTVTPSIIVTFVWQTVGLVMVLILLGLAAIPKEPVEAARVEGATPWQTFRHVIFPLLLPTLLVVIIISVLAGFTVFDLLWVMGTSYPGKRSLSLVVYMYYEAFSRNAWSYGSAVAVVIGLVVLFVTAFQIYAQNRVEKLIK